MYVRQDLEMLHALKCAWFWPLGALPLDPMGFTYMYHLNNFESPTP